MKTRDQGGTLGNGTQHVTWGHSWVLPPPAVSPGASDLVSNRHIPHCNSHLPHTQQSFSRDSSPVSVLANVTSLPHPHHTMYEPADAIFPCLTSLLNLPCPLPFLSSAFSPSTRPPSWPGKFFVCFILFFISFRYAK